MQEAPDAMQTKDSRAITHHNMRWEKASVVVSMIIIPDQIATKRAIMITSILAAIGRECVALFMDFHFVNRFPVSILLLVFAAPSLTDGERDNGNVHRAAANIIFPKSRAARGSVCNVLLSGDVNSNSKRNF